MNHKPQFRTVCNVTEIPSGEARMFVVKDTTIGVFHVDGKFFAINDRCPHAGASLSLGYIEGDVVCCRMHHWRFCIKDGTCLDEEQHASDTQSYSVRVVGEHVQVAL